MIVATLMALAAATPASLPVTLAPAEVLECAANSLVSWQNGEATADQEDTSHPYERTFTFDMVTGAFHMLPSEVEADKTGSFEIVSVGDVGPAFDKEADLVAFDRQNTDLLRVRLTYGEYQFLYDRGRTLYVGTCSVVTP